MGDTDSAANASTPDPRQDGQVVLFSGHMIDAPNRTTSRFPPAMVQNAAAAIRDTLAAWSIGPGDLGICGGACGGDLLFAEACLDRDARVDLLLPFDIPQFIQRSVAFAGEGWVRLFHDVSRDSRTSVLIMPDAPGPTREGTSPYVRHAQWLLDHAFVHGPDRLRFLSLWDSKAGDGPGGTRHMLDEISHRGGRIEIIDTASL